MRLGRHSRKFRKLGFLIGSFRRCRQLPSSARSPPSRRLSFTSLALAPVLPPPRARRAHRLAWHCPQMLSSDWMRQLLRSRVWQRSPAPRAAELRTFCPRRRAPAAPAGRPEQGARRWRSGLSGSCRRAAGHRPLAASRRTRRRPEACPAASGPSSRSCSGGPRPRRSSVSGGPRTAAGRMWGVARRRSIWPLPRSRPCGGASRWSEGGTTRQQRRYSVGPVVSSCASGVPVCGRRSGSSGTRAAWSRGGRSR
mmetsp:Transcript_90673/g.292650  ORF Transcript_90673/g.292650 Transcript_90673/m.292650 type:complete len:253 (-) Transcript_90673:1361-2119(-)